MNANLNLSSGMTAVAGEVRAIQEKLERAGWVVINALGEQTSPDHVVWFSAGYVSGEYTVEAHYRPTGAGPAQEPTRVRITPPLVQAHPGLGARLAQDLIDIAAEAAHVGSIKDVAWPPENWKALAR